VRHATRGASWTVPPLAHGAGGACAVEQTVRHVGILRRGTPSTQRAWRRVRVAPKRPLLDTAGSTSTRRPCCGSRERIARTRASELAIPSSESINQLVQFVRIDNISWPTRGPNVRRTIGSTTRSRVVLGTKAPANDAVPRRSAPSAVASDSACHAGGRGFESRRSRRCSCASDAPDSRHDGHKAAKRRSGASSTLAMRRSSCGT
jgi:hypothetical protein